MSGPLFANIFLPRTPVFKILIFWNPCPHYWFIIWKQNVEHWCLHMRTIFKVRTCHLFWEHWLTLETQTTLAVSWVPATKSVFQIFLEHQLTYKNRQKSIITPVFWAKNVCKQTDLRRCAKFLYHIWTSLFGPSSDCPIVMIPSFRSYKTRYM